MLSLLAIPLSFVNPRAGRTNNPDPRGARLSDLQQRGECVCQAWVGQGACASMWAVDSPPGDAGCAGHPCSTGGSAYLRAGGGADDSLVYIRYLSREIYAAVFLVPLAFLGLFAFFDLVNELDEIGKGATCFITRRFTSR